VEGDGGDALADVPVQADLTEISETADVEPDLASPPDILDASLAETGDTLPDAVGLAMPATWPDDLPPGVVAVPLAHASLSNLGESAPLKATLPPKTVGFAAVLLGQHPGFFELSKATSPKGYPLAKGQCTAVCVSCANRVGASPGTGTALFPSSSNVTITGGAWDFKACAFQWFKQGNKFQLGPWHSAPIDILLFAKTSADGLVPDKGRLRIVVHLTGGAGLTAANAPTDARMQATIATATTLLGAAGITLEVAGWRDTMPGHEVVELPEDLTTTGASNFDLLAVQAKGVPGAHIDVFIVDKLIGGTEGKGVVGGVAGAIPGPAFYHGIPRAALALALGIYGEDGAFAGYALAHEIGHYLGLWHVTEADGEMNDPLDDTPACTKVDDGNADGVLVGDECAGKGADNVMFWLAGANNPAFSGEQGAVMRANPLVLPP